MNRGGQLVKLDPRVWALAETHSQSFTVGDRVYGCMRFGACASYVNVPAHQIRKMPNNWNFSQGAAFTAQTLTSYYALKELGNIRSGKVVFIHSLAGGCGMQALKICEKLGASVIGTVGRPEKVLKLLERFPHLSIEQIIVRTTAKELGGQIDTALGYLQHKASIVSHSGIDIVMDAVLGDWFQPVYDRLRPGGRYIVYGAADMTPNSNKLGWNEWLRLGYQWLLRPKLDLLEVPSKNVGVMGFNLIHLLNDAELLLLLMEEMEALSLEPPHVGHEFEFSELVPALSLFRSGKTTGKVVLKV
ncbi:hypothetical protein SARC_09606 [Sphaeroforma arctica JP610]|uniref:Enoyl reductase (ER) domain-containing protein n=1 Tax=Sphaeroforma arctica JP610 TaxID=667725 RepID=A0A0L0FMF0_9EUKA|nr:hypothetical protein SARC_09606 [Sphaeroforma arctica JP610]KNC77949.1 hypothetical protein SARC_09606 [Sphaeroforma arctica JP610]|eukprot:XP_014151851.1 hypothetical protein SARC_09606 [Sphaeroforma arctica JP610]